MTSFFVNSRLYIRRSDIEPENTEPEFIVKSPLQAIRRDDDDEDGKVILIARA